MRMSTVKEFAEKLSDNVAKVIVGKNDEIEKIITVMLIGGHVLLEDVPGTGKTKLAKAFAASLDTGFGRIQFTPDLLPADVTGLNVYNQKQGEFTFVKGPIFTNILLADEINRATPRTQSALLECMEEEQVTTDGVTRKLSAPFFIIATENPIETAGTYPLPEAQLDRFTMQLSLGYPSINEELIIMERFMGDDTLSGIEKVCTVDELLAAKDAVKKVFVHESVKRYIAELIQATRNSQAFTLGVNPRGTLALLRCSQAYAALKGRAFVTPDDVKALSVSVLSHRLYAYSMLRPNGVQDEIRKIVERLPVPTEDWER